MAKHTINLLQPELIPEQPTWTLGKVVSLWAITLVAMLAWLFWTDYQLSVLKADVAQSNLTKNTLQNEQARLEKRVADNKPDKRLVEQLETIKYLLENKRSLHQQLTDKTTTYAAGFSAAMHELSQYHHRDISLNRIVISGDYVRFDGVANTPESVPSWLTAFEQSTFLSGLTFSHFELKENANKLTEFAVSSYKDDSRER